MSENNIRIVIIEDDSFMSSIYESLFQLENVQTLVLSGKEDVVRECGDFQPDLVLLDLNLEHQTGFDVIKLLKTNQSTKHIPVIFLSSEYTPETIAQGYYLGAVEFIEKTPNVVDLVRHIKTMAILETMSSGIRRVRELIDKIY